MRETTDADPRAVLERLRAGRNLRQGQHDAYRELLATASKDLARCHGDPDLIDDEMQLLLDSAGIDPADESTWPIHIGPWCHR